MCETVGTLLTPIFIVLHVIKGQVVDIQGKCNRRGVQVYSNDVLGHTPLLFRIYKYFRFSPWQYITLSSLLFKDIKTVLEIRQRAFFFILKALNIVKSSPLFI